MTFLRGLDIRVGPAPRQTISDTATAARITLAGSDYPFRRADVLVTEGETVARGAPLFRDKHRPEIVVTAPCAGRVDAVTLGARRRLSEIALTADGDGADSFDIGEPMDRGNARRVLLASGLWASLRRRPFGHIPDPESEPDALFVIATDPWWGAPDPRVVCDAEPDALPDGLHVLRHVTDAPIYVCQPEGVGLAPAGGHVHRVEVAGGFPDGLAGTQIDRVMPIVGGRTVWQIGYQDVMAIGRLYRTGQLDLTRVVSIVGPLARDPRLVRLTAGADISVLAAAEAEPGPRRVMSGNALAGRESAFLRRGHTQVTLLPRIDPSPRRSWLPTPRTPLRPAALIPHVALGAALGPDIPVLPLLRALSVGDAREVDRLGGRGLLEEDVAALTYLSGGGLDYGHCLRDVLDRLEAAA